MKNGAFCIYIWSNGKNKLPIWSIATATKKFPILDIIITEIHATNLSIQFDELGIEMPRCQRLEVLINYPMEAQQHKPIKIRSIHIFIYI